MFKETLESKPYTYSITEKGKAKVEQVQVSPIVGIEKFQNF